MTPAVDEDLTEGLGRAALENAIASGEMDASEKLVLKKELFGLRVASCIAT